jgi:hypothetical protein
MEVWRFGEQPDADTSQEVPAGLLEVPLPEPEPNGRLV